MYKIENGILTKDGKKVFCIGQSYYPSFHKAKYPVPPEGDRAGEMKKDLKMMSEMGFNHVRYAAIGDVELKDEKNLDIDTPFVNSMIEEADKNGMSVSLRLEGYVVNLHNYEDVLMIDNKGNPQDVNIWSDFIQSTLHHSGLKQDNKFHAGEMAKYYKKFDNMVAYQIYNEPHYPSGHFFDYHPCAIEAYRIWLAENGYMSQAEAKSYNPPRTRDEQTPHLWAIWRIFSRDSLTNFLADAAIAANKASGISTYTCYTTCQGSGWGPFRGVDYYGGIKNMSIAGYTTYINAEGSNYYTMTKMCDMNYTAAKLEGKETWCIELDSRTKIPLDIFNKNTYAVIGSGAKGILYYQWRGDYPSEATPIPNGCGLLNYDGSKVPNYENASKMVKFINRMSDHIVNAEPANCKIGILHSDYSVYYCDALENGHKEISEIEYNSCTADIEKIYTDTRKAGFSAHIIPSYALKENKLDLKILLVPKTYALSDEDKMYIEKFISQGGKAYEYVTTAFESGYKLYGEETGLYMPFMEFDDLVKLLKIVPPAKADNSSAALQLMEGDGYRLIVITNTSCHEKEISTDIKCNFNVTSATLCSSLSDDVNLEVSDNTIHIDKIGDGGIVVIK